MNNIFNHYAVPVTNAAGQATGQHVLYRDGAQKACAEVLLVTKQVSEAKMEAYMAVECGAAGRFTGIIAGLALGASTVSQAGVLTTGVTAPNGSVLISNDTDTNANMTVRVNGSIVARLSSPRIRHPTPAMPDRIPHPRLSSRPR